MKMRNSEEANRAQHDRDVQGMDWQGNQPSSQTLPRISRRRFIASAGLTTAAVCFSPGQILAEKENIVLAARKRAETAELSVQALRRNVRALIGSGGNIAVLTGSDGKLIIDSGYATSHNKITKALSSMGPEAIQHIINTHRHFDHTDGNAWMHEVGASI